MKTLRFLLIPYSLFLTPLLCSAQIAINNTSSKPNVSAILDLNTGNSGVNKGFLAPQVALTNVNAAAPVTTPATGLMVYSTSAPTGGNGAGYYYWNGTAWSGFGAYANSTNGQAAYANSSVAAGDSVIGATYGVYGYSANQNYAGVYGENDYPGYGIGVEGYSTGRIGVLGYGGQYGVYANGDNGTGIYGIGGIGGQFTGDNGPAVYGYSFSGPGDSSIGTTYGVYGYTPDPNGQFAGVYGQDDNFAGVWGTSANGFGVYGQSASYGVYGNGGIYGGYFIGTYGGVISFSHNAAGDSSVGATYGIYGITSDPNGSYAGVYGQDDNSAGVAGSSANQVGVYGNSTNNIGVYGTGVSGGKFIGSSYGLYAIDATYDNLAFLADNIDGYGVLGKGISYGGVFIGTIGVHGEGTGAKGHAENHNEGVYGEGGTCGVVGYADGHLGEGGYFADSTNVYAYVAYNNGTNYKILGSGTNSTIVKDNNNVRRIMASPEAPEILFEDYGTATLTAGKVHVDLDPTYVKNVTINEKHPLRVIIQLNDTGCNAVAVINRTATGFDVVELNRGKSNAAFTYEVIANRADDYDDTGKLISKNADNRWQEGPGPLTEGQADNSTIKIPAIPKLPAKPTLPAQPQNPGNK